MHRLNLQCWRILFLLLLLTHTIRLHHLWDVRPYVSSWVFLSSAPFDEVLLRSTLRMVPSILRRGQYGYLYLLCSLVSSSFLAFLNNSCFLFFVCSFFFHLRLFDGVRFQYSQVSVRFLFSKRSDFFWSGSSNSSVIYRFIVIVIIIIYSWWAFHTSVTWGGHRSLIDSKSLLESSEYYYCTPLRGFYTNVSWWFFAGVWVTANLFNSSGYFFFLLDVLSRLGDLFVSKNQFFPTSWCLFTKMTVIKPPQVFRTLRSI